MFHYGYSDFSSRKWSIAVQRTASRAVKNIEEFPMKAYYIQKEFLDIGKSTGNFNGVMLDAMRKLQGNSVFAMTLSAKRTVRILLCQEWPLHKSLRKMGAFY